jgi:hypothetical protein
MQHALVPGEGPLFLPFQTEPQCCLMRFFILTNLQPSVSRACASSTGMVTRSLHDESVSVSFSANSSVSHRDDAGEPEDGTLEQHKGRKHLGV